MKVFSQKKLEVVDPLTIDDPFVALLFGTGFDSSHVGSSIGLSDSIGTHEGFAEKLIRNSSTILLFCPLA